MSTELFGRDSELRDFRRRLNKNAGELIGYYGIAGIGKSSLLHEFRKIALEITPYVAYVDFTPGQPTAWNTPAATLVSIIHQLQETQLTTPRSGLFRRRLPSPFLPSLAVLGFTSSRNSLNVNLIAAFNSTVNRNIQMVGNLPKSNQPLEEAQVIQATYSFVQALRSLHVKAKIEFERVGAYIIRPVVVVIADSVELAPISVQKWLTQLASESNQEFLYLVAAGRDPISALLTEELKPFSTDAANQFLINWIGVNEQRTRDQLVRLCHGIPFCLEIAGLTVRKFGDDLTDVPIDSIEKQLAADFLVERYLSRVEKAVNTSNETGERRLLYVLRYAPILRRVDPNVLKAILDGLPHTEHAFPREEVDFVKLWQDVKDHTFILGDRFHDIVRSTTLRLLKQDEPDQWVELHTRAAAYYETISDHASMFYHQLSVSNERWLVFVQELLSSVERGELARAKDLRASIDSLEIPSELRVWFDLADGLSAFAGGNTVTAEQILIPLLVQENLSQPINRYLDNWSAAVATRSTQAQSDLVLLGIVRYAQSNGNLLKQATSKLLLSANAIDRQDYHVAQLWLTEALKFFQLLGNKLGEAYSLFGLGVVDEYQGYVGRAKEYLLRASNIFQSLGDGYGDAHTVRYLAYLLPFQFTEISNLFAEDPNGIFDSIGENFKRHKDTVGELYLAFQRSSYLSSLYFALLGFNVLQKQTSSSYDAKVVRMSGVTTPRLKMESQDDVLDQSNRGNIESIFPDWVKNKDLPVNALPSPVDVPGESSEGMLSNLESFDEANGVRGQATIYFAEGVLQARLRQGSAFTHLAKSLSLFRSISDHHGQACVLRTIGEAKLKNWDERNAGLVECNQALRIYKTLGDLYGQAQTLLTIANLHQRWENEREAEKCSISANELRSLICAPYAAVESLPNISSLIMSSVDPIYGICDGYPIGTLLKRTANTLSSQ